MARASGGCIEAAAYWGPLPGFRLVFTTRRTSPNVAVPHCAPMPDLSILMPVYNEEATVERAMQRVLDAELPVPETELVVVDDGSTDATHSILSAAEWPSSLQLLRHPTNRGKGAAVRMAATHARGEYTAILDADLEYDPADLGRLLEPLLSGRAEAVFGTREFESHSSYGAWYVLGNKAVTLAANLLYNAWISDLMTCLKAMRTERLTSFRLREPGFGIEAEITARLLRSGIRIHEVPITYTARSREEGKKLHAVDAARVLATLLRCRFD
jgi:glycosyltransferase involved in cell wall biosynthesis